MMLVARYCSIFALTFLPTTAPIKLADGTVQRLGQDVEGIFGTKIWR